MISLGKREGEGWTTERTNEVREKRRGGCYKLMR